MAQATRNIGSALSVSDAPKKVRLGPYRGRTFFVFLLTSATAASITQAGLAAGPHWCRTG